MQEVGHWSRASSYWCWKVVAGSGLVAAGSCCCREVVVGAGLVAAGAGRWSLLQEGGRRSWTVSCWCRKEIVAAGKRSLMQDW